MSRALRWIVPLVVLLVIGFLLYPHLKNAARYYELIREPMPAHLPVPVKGVLPRSLVDTWGGARSEGRKHEGIDIFAKKGTPILSSTHGIVTRKGWNRLGGETVTVLGPGGNYHYYAHLSRYADLKVGQWVEKGTVLGEVGNTGNARTTPPHLHYGIYDFKWKAMNPYPFLK
ncbi:M23 family metallopeptidase [Deinococcus roseus]|uniref:Peptidase M23 n=1 Tax=Deinococcus roseus TaxID=392414 RepID=A0ABQ2D143_9DEIO|nr:M23 family metallopeptidase [Deinococcus roseus]GGJ41039.1 peptidase M23 [Deinococcus roseus]